MAERLGAPLRAVQTRSASDNRCALAVATDGRSGSCCLSTDASGCLAALDGEVYGLLGGGATDGEVTEEELRIAPAPALLRCYHEHGLEFVPRLRGAFTLAIWDPRSHLLRIANDRHGLRPCYYRVEGDRIAFASRVRALLACSQWAWIPDEHGLADFLCLGFPLSDRTLFTGVQLVPPASILTFEGGRSSVRAYWSLRFRSGSEAVRSVNEGAALLQPAFVGALRAMTAGLDCVEVPLSGGLDSRCVAAAAYHIGIPVRTYTLGSAGSADLRLGPRVAESLGVANQAWTLTAEDLVDWVEEAVYLTDGMYNPADSAILFISRRLLPGSRIVLDGMNSFEGMYRFYEPLLGRLLPRPEQSRKLMVRVLERPLFGMTGHTLFAPFLASDYAARIEPLIRSSLDAMHARWSESGSADLFDSLDYLDQSLRVTRYNIMGTNIMRAYCQVRHPFFDPAVVDVVTQLDPLLRAKEKRVQGRMLAALAPDLARIPYERTGLRADASALRIAAAYASKATKRMAGRAFAGLRPRRKVAIDFAALARTGSSLQTYLRSVLLDRRTLDRGFTDAAKTEQLLDAASAGADPMFMWALRLLTVELWYRFFVEGEEPSIPEPSRRDG